MSKEKSMVTGIVWSLVDVKLLLTSILILCSMATLLQLLPSNSSSSFLSCLSSQPPPPLINFTSPKPQQETLTSNSGVLKRSFNPIGSAAYLFIQMGAYRGGANSFAVVGLGSKPLHVFSKPTFTCIWTPTKDSVNSSKTTVGSKILPDWGYGRVYTVVVVNCSFPEDIGVDGSGGRLTINTTTGAQGDDKVESFVALEETPGSFNVTELTAAPPKYDILYCGSSLYGNLSPQRVREWMAYHARLFGARAHFVFHDAGGVHPAVVDVLRPWMELGLITLQDIREQEKFDGYYHNQFLVVNDCLHRYRHAAKWMFFFDIDEFLYVEPKSTLRSLLDSLSGYTQFTIEQMPMSNELCLSSDSRKTSRMWGIEKLVYRDVKRGVRRDRKYAIQPRNVFATGVHMSQDVAGRTLHKLDGRVKYFHYHGTLAQRREPCRKFVNGTELTVENTPYVFDDTLRSIVGSVKRYELKAIGSRLGRTRQ